MFEEWYEKLEVPQSIKRINVRMLDQPFSTSFSIPRNLIEAWTMLAIEANRFGLTVLLGEVYARERYKVVVREGIRRYAELGKSLGMSVEELLG